MSDLPDLIVAFEPGLRLAAFGFVLAAMALWETLAPKRPLQMPRLRRGFTNLSLSLLNSLMLRGATPVLAASIALDIEDSSIGLFNQLTWPPALEFVLAVLLLDLLIYGQHIAFHKIPVLWRLHRVHHADRDIDTTTGVRFHPVEIALSMGVKVLAVLALGPSAAAVIFFEVLLNATSLFNHGNVRMPPILDKILRLLLVTPDMHRVHHSVHVDETDSNYGFNLSVWDRIFRTYRPQPRDGHIAMSIGLNEFRGAEPTRIGWSLKLPLSAPTERQR